LNDKRLIEDYLPIEAISAEASREKSVRKGHISTLHLWWARRPLVACRAAVYGALVPASQFVPENGPDNKKQSLGRANAAKFVTELCKYPGNPRFIAEAQKHILDAHADRLTAELKDLSAVPGTAQAGVRSGGAKPAWVEEFKFKGEQVTREDIEAGRAPRPRVLDMFAGGGAIPLEALRLGCEAYALDLNPVAHIIELCTLVYPQKYGQPDTNARGMTGPKDKDGHPTWGGLAEEVKYWGNWVLEKVKEEIGDLYPPIPDPKAAPEEIGKRPQSVMKFAKDTQGRLTVPKGYLTPVAYLWTRTVTCKNPACTATVPLARQTWLCKKKDRYVAAKTVTDVSTRCIRFEIVEAKTEKALGFSPEAGSKGGNATCPFCGTVADIDYVKEEGWAGRIGQQLMAVACSRRGSTAKVYIAADELTHIIPTEKQIRFRLERLCAQSELTVPTESIANQPSTSRENTLGVRVRPYGIRTWGDLFTYRQQVCLLSFVQAVHNADGLLTDHPQDIRRAVTAYLALLVDRVAIYSSTLCVWHYQQGERTAKTFARHAISMTWDFAESNPFNEENASYPIALNWIVPAIAEQSGGRDAIVFRGSALATGMSDNLLDAVVTDPPYYDNVPYAEISDYFYVWLRRTVGHLYAEHFASEGTPKKGEAIADADRHGGSKQKAREAYEEMMANAFAEAHRILKPSGQLVVVYAHKTTLGWTTLVDALRRSGFAVTEAWPIDSEQASRMQARESAALATSIFLVARKREGQEKGQYEFNVQPELEKIVRERVQTLWDMGVSGADLLIACVGAGLRAFTRYVQVEYANGESVPAERFLFEVESVVLDSILARLSKEVGANGGRYGLGGIDPATRFYILWRYTYRMAELDAGEAIVFANGTHVELEGPHSITYGTRALAERKKSNYRLRDYSERGDDEKLGLPHENGTPAPIIDALHRTLWLMENRPRALAEFLRDSGVNREQMRLVAQALAGPSLKGGEMGDVSPTGELAALSKIMANWRSVVEDATMTITEKEDRAKKQTQFDFGKGK